MTAQTPPVPPGTPAVSPFNRVRFVTELARFLQAETPREPRPFKLPDLPPGVLPQPARVAMDSGLTQMFAWLNANPTYCNMGFPGYPYLSELAQRSEYRAPVEVIANELVRAWIKFTNVTEEQNQELTAAFKEFAIRDHVREMAIQDGFFGCGHLYVSIKGQDGQKRRAQPLNVDPAGIARDSLLGFKAVEPIWVAPYSYNSQDPTAPNFYKPDFWYVMGIQTHASRLLTFIGRPLPDAFKPSYNFGGISLSQLIEPYVNRWLKTVDSVNRLISNFSTMAIATNMAASLQDGGDIGGFFERLKMFNATRDNRGLFVLDKDSEELVQVNTPLSGLHELQAQAQEHMAAPTHIPLVKLTGITPSGLNASSDGEIKVFYDWIASEQVNLIEPHLNTILKIVQCHLWGKIDENIGFEWVPLDSPTDAELSGMRKADADAGCAYVDRGIVSAAEERTRLRNDPNSGYTHIDPEDVPVSPLEAEAEVGEAGAQADHERGEESAEEGHRRALELLDREAANAPAQDEQQRDRLGRFGSGGGTPETREAVFEQLYAYQQTLEAAERTASSAVKQFDKFRTAGSATVGGLIPDDVKASPEYKTARAAYETASRRLREFNAKFVPAFKKELAAKRAR